MTNNDSINSPNHSHHNDNNDNTNGHHAKKLKTIPCIDNYFGGKHVPPSNGEYIDVTNPATGEVIALVAASSSPTDVEKAIQSAHHAFREWSGLTLKARAAVMLKFHSLIREHTEELAACIVQENGKNITEAIADVAKANETVEYACSLPQLATGRTLAVSSGGVTCRDQRVPLGIVVSIVPFNFPLMVPCWTLPIALVMGNAIIIKPSEKVPLTLHRTMRLVEQAGFPPGIITLLQTNQPSTVQALIRHPQVQAVTFVGSSPVAKIIATECRSLHKRCIALGGAKNHLVALATDCDLESTAQDVVVSFAGCAGQRCMAAPVLLIIPDDKDGGTKAKQLVDLIVTKASNLQPGSGPGQVGPVIDQNSFTKIHNYIQDSVEKDQAQILLDGRSWARSSGNWVGPTIILHQSSNDKAMREEIFGPVLSIYYCSSWEEAIQIENDNPFGNAACIYTTNGGHSEWFLERFRAGMLG